MFKVVSLKDIEKMERKMWVELHYRVSAEYTAKLKAMLKSKVLESVES